MSLIWTNSGPYQRIGYEDEADLEAAILQVQADLFGPDRIYLDVKRKIGAKGGPRNIPDGYLLDLSGRQPWLCMFQNELAAPIRFAMWLTIIAYNLGNLWRRLAMPQRIGDWSLTSLQQRLVKTGGRLIKHTRYYWLLLAESHPTRRLFASMLGRIDGLSLPSG